MAYKPGDRWVNECRNDGHPCLDVTLLFYLSTNPNPYTALAGAYMLTPGAPVPPPTGPLQRRLSSTRSSRRALSAASPCPPLHPLRSPRHLAA